MSDVLDQIELKAWRRIVPPPRMRLSKWAEKHIELPEGLAARPGPIRLYPFQREIADAISDPTIERVTVRKAVRIGYTTLLVSTIGSYVSNEPAPILALFPTDSDCRNFIVSDLEPIIASSPTLAGTLAIVKTKDAEEAGRSTIRHRSFPGGSLKIVAARAPRNLRAHTVRVLLIDEEDGMVVTPEGDALDLAIKRTMSFPNRKIIRGSTPTDEDTSTICREYAVSDQRVYKIACVDCGTLSEPLWEHIKWDKILDGKSNIIGHRPETATWECPSCKSLIQERYKQEMVAKGAWIAQRPEVKGHAGFALSALISPLQNASWGVLAAEYLQVHHDPDRHRTFRNTILGVGWRESLEQATPEALMARAEMFGLNTRTADGQELPFPEQVLYVTVGVDVQQDRLEVAVYGWDKLGAAYALGHFVYWGNTSEGQVWNTLDQLLSQRWTHPKGGTIGIECMCVDSGDGVTSEVVYRYAWPRLARNVIPIKGASGRRPIIEASKGKVSGGALGGEGRLWIVGVDEVKQLLLTKTSRYPDQIRFSAGLTLNWFTQFCAERRVIRMVAGRPVRRFERTKNEPAEALDCTVYAFAARYALPPMDFAARERALTETRASGTRAVAPVRPVRRSGYMGR